MHCETCTCHKPKKGPKAPRIGEKMTPAKAAALRKRNAELCGCVSCRWALNPPLTFAAHALRMLECERMNTDGAWPAHKTWADLAAEGRS